MDYFTHLMGDYTTHKSRKTVLNYCLSFTHMIKEQFEKVQD